MRLTALAGADKMVSVTPGPAGDGTVAPATPTGPAAAAGLALVLADPAAAQELAWRCLAAAPADLAEQSVAHRVLGLVARERHDGPAALQHLRQAVRLAEAGGLAVPAAEARMSLALALDDIGRPHDALRELDRAAAVLRGVLAARVRMQRGIVLRRLGRHELALADYRAALTTFRRHGDRRWQARAYTNRGVLHVHRGARRRAEADLLSAERLYAALGDAMAVAQVRHNLGFAAARAGDVPAALAHYDRADEYFRRVGRPPAALQDRADLLLRVRLLPEARSAAEAAVAALARGRMAWHLARARLTLAEVALAQGDLPAARRAARLAHRSLLRQDRPGTAALARYAEIRSWDPTGHPTRSTVTALARCADALADAGLAAPALDARVLAAETALKLRRPDVAREQLSRAGALTRGTVEVRARAWHARALLRDLTGHRAGARRALTAGLRLLDEHRAALGATELRASTAVHAATLAMSGLRMALADGRPATVLAWAERCRAMFLRTPTVRPPDDPALAADLAALRRTAAELAELPDRGGARRSALIRTLRGLEEAVRRRTLRVAGPGVPAPADPPRLDRLMAALGERSLVELFDVDGELHALLVDQRGVGLHRLGPARAAADELTAMRFALRRLVLRHGSAASLAAALASARHAAQRLDAQLLGPLSRRLRDRPLVVAATGVLHAVGWALLPSCRQRPLTVTPSASAWLSAAGRPEPREAPTVLVAGPGLAHADGEVQALGAALGETRIFTGSRATVDAVTAALDGAGMAHFAAHGEFRADNPLFSHLRLVDGPLTGYDLERLGRTPRRLVLSACDSGLSVVRPGNELMGLAATVLAAGTETLIATTGPVADDVSRSFMVAFHRRLRGGQTPAAALVAARSDVADADPATTATIGSFTCFGAG